MEPEHLDIPRIARKLEVSEHTARRLLSECLSTGTGKHGAALYHWRDVEMIGRRHRLGFYGRQARRVLVHQDLETQMVALEAAGLAVALCESVLDALTQHAQPGKPILVLPASQVRSEAGMLDIVIHDLEIIVIGEDVSEHVRLNSTQMPDGALRRLVRHAWMLVERRLEQTDAKI